MPTTVPPEVLYDIIAIVCVRYIDDCYARSSRLGLDEYNPVVQLLQVNHRFRAITRMVMESTLGIETDNNGLYAILRC